MRLFTLIFSIYLLAVSLLPCSDAYNECNNKTATARVQAAFTDTQEHNHKSDHNDLCGPFCTCACCGTILTAVTGFSVFAFHSPQPQVSEDPKFPIWNVDVDSDYLGSIWRPPSNIA